jgi:hypothetical protein
MGQANKRGTFEVRKAQALERRAAEPVKQKKVSLPMAAAMMALLTPFSFDDFSPGQRAILPGMD